MNHRCIVKEEVKPMRNALRWYFWLETGMAIVTGVLFIITLVHRDWIETIFNIDPDNGSGTLEWLIVGVLLVVTVTLFTLASFEWRRARAAIS
jgi:hypothetical protein